MKIGVIIPDRGDRPEFLKNCIRMMERQTIQPYTIELIDDKPENSKCDITKRYRIGYDRLRNKGLDVIALIENDDWYSPVYLETMTKTWGEQGSPDIFGTNYTIYYHLKLKAWFKNLHNSRSSAMNTFIRPDMNFKWCQDSEPYTDLHLWRNMKGKTFCPMPVISIGIKHGSGLCGGRMHIDRLEKYINKDPHGTFLLNTMDAESYEFYFRFSSMLT